MTILTLNFWYQLSHTCDYKTLYIIIKLILGFFDILILFCTINFTGKHEYFLKELKKVSEHPEDWVYHNGKFHYIEDKMKGFVVDWDWEEPAYLKKWQNNIPEATL